MVAFAQVVSSVEVVAFSVGEQFLLSSIGDASVGRKGLVARRSSGLAFHTAEEVPDGAQCVMNSALLMLNFFPR